MSNSDLSFVRAEMMEEQAPPITQTGIIKWARENLFSSPLNIGLTLLAIYLAYVILSGLLPWLFNSVWSAASLTECREILGAYGKGGHAGACTGVIEDRWKQFLFGFYPADQYWRPILTIILFFVALAPVLYAERVPKKMLAFSAVYPFLAVWLLWGGAFWSTLLILAGFVVAYVVFQVVGKAFGTLIGFISGIVAILIWWGIAVGSLDDGIHRWVGTMRLESRPAEMALQIEQLPQEIAALETLQDDLQINIDEGLTVKDRLLAEISVGLEDTTLSVDLDGLRDELGETMNGLEALRKEQTTLAGEAHRNRLELSRIRNLMTKVSELSANEAALPGLREEAKALRATLPTSVSGLGERDIIPSDVSREDADTLQAARTAESRLRTTEDAIKATYTGLGRIGFTPVESRDFGGFTLALIIGISGIVISLPLGILLALGRQSDLFVLNKVSVIFIETIRGVPLIVWLFTAQLLLNYFLPPGTNFDLLLRVIIMVTLFSSAYIAEVVRGGLAALPTGQYEAADAMGLNYWQSMQLIILPQALKISIPGIVSSFIGLFKDTTLVVFIGLLDPVGLGNTTRASTDWNGVYWEIFIFIGLIFFIFCYSMGRYSMYLEKKLQREHR